MITLKVDEFSCIKSVNFQVAPVTILIGPQGSGKSVTTKLVYFFFDILNNKQFQCAEKGISLDSFKRDIALQFSIWFPPSAWGRHRFSIVLEAGEIIIRIRRRVRRGVASDEIVVSFSEHFDIVYKDLQNSYEGYRLRQVGKEDGAITRTIDESWKIRVELERKIASTLGDAYFREQTFIPAGRAFFTSIGRLVAALEHGSLDPVTIRFAKLFANLRDNLSRGGVFRSPARKEDTARRRTMRKLFGGDLRFENDLEFVETSDGRRIPFTALSSGQQELIPIWILLDFYIEIDDFRSNRKLPYEYSSLIYIEEPEAHLFPEAQSVLMDFLTGSLVSGSKKRSMILTTHSPYILMKINNYLKAGTIGRSRKHAAEVLRLVPKQCWLAPSRVKAYALADGTLVDLIGDDGLVDASYIDSVSDEASRIFSALLDIEYPETVG